MTNENHLRRSAALAVLFALALLAAPAAQQRVAGWFPEAKDAAVRFLVIGYPGTGDRRQAEVADRIVNTRALFPFEFALMLGDNLYGPERPEDYARKFERPYRPLLDAGVEFYAVLGNHDEPEQRFYEPFNMNGSRYYTFTRGAARFFALDSTAMTPAQLAWFEEQLDASNEDWKLVFMHHPLYSSGRRHGPSEDLRALIEPLMVEHGVTAVFAGHEHFYERIKPQKGIAYFTSGAAGKLRRGDIVPSSITAAGFDRDRSFMLLQIDGEEMAFQAISRDGTVVDSGLVPRRGRELAGPGLARISLLVRP